MIGLIVLLFGEMSALKFKIRKAVEYYNWDLVDHASRFMEDSSSDSNFNYGALAHEVAKEKKNISMWSRD